jgi:proline iminopeptidase
VNEQVNRSWKQYIQRPSLLKELAQLDLPALFLYGEQDTRPNWPVEQVAQLLPDASFQILKGADHHSWTTHAEEMRESLHRFIREIAEANT